VQNLGREDNPGVYNVKLGFLSNALRRIGADLVVIDEVREPESFAELADAVGLYPERFLADPPEENRRIQIGILTRLEVVERGQWYDFPAMLPGSQQLNRLKFRRPIPWIQVRLGNGNELFVAAVHLKSQRAEVESIPETETLRKRIVLGQALSGTGRILEGAGLRCLLDEVMEQRKADYYAVMGDFNDRPDSETVRLILGGDTEEPVKGTTCQLFPVSGWIPEKRRFSYKDRMKQELLDHILVSRDLCFGLSRAGVENQLIEGEKRRSSEMEGYPRSDHAPVWAIFELPSPA